MRRNRRIIPLPYKAMLYWFFLSLTGAIVSGAIAYGVQISKHEAESFRRELPELLKISLYTGICFVIFAFLVAIFRPDFFYRNTYFGHEKSLKRRIFFSVFLVFVLSMTLLVTNAIFTNSPMATILINPGGLFAVTTGIFTIVGFYITIHSILEIRHKIDSFPELIHKLSRLLSETDDGDYVRFMTITPAIGSLALPELYWDGLLKDIEKNHKKIEIICLEHEDLCEFHNYFLDRTTNRGYITQEIIDKINNESETLLKNYFHGQDGFRMAYRLKSDKMPGYYMFANRKKAIVAAPFFMPLPSHKLKPEAVKTLPSVTMFGFETGDPGIIASVIQMYEVYKNS